MRSVDSVVPSRQSARVRIGLSVVLAATFMGQVDGFIVTVAAPTIQRELPASFGDIQFVGAGYVLACAAGLVAGARLGDRFGRRRVFLLGVALFTAASLACGLAPNPELLIAARVVQGAAAAALVPQELALIRSMFADEERRARAFALYAMVIGLGVIFGLAGGGFLVHWDIAGLGWRTAFLVNVPIGLLILALGRSTIDESRSTAATNLDLGAMVLTALLLPYLLLPLILGLEPSADTRIWWCWPLAAVWALLLIRRERAVLRSGREPLYSMRVLGSARVRHRLAAIAAFFAGNAGLFIIFSYYVQTGLNMDPLAAGLMFVPLGIGFSVGSAISARAFLRLGEKLPVLGCSALAVALAANLLVVHTSPDAQHVLLAMLIGIVGFAEGFVVSPLISGIFRHVSVDDAGAASGAASTVTQVGLATGFALIGSVYRLVLGDVPGSAGSTLDSAVSAYSVSVVLLVVLAIVTAALCSRADRVFVGGVV